MSGLADIHHTPYTVTRGQVSDRPEGAWAIMSAVKARAQTFNQLWRVKVGTRFVTSDTIMISCCNLYPLQNIHLFALTIIPT